MESRKWAGVLLTLAFLIGLAWLLWPAPRGQDEALEDERGRKLARAQCERWAERLETQTSDSGVYVRWQGEDLPEKDPWGRTLKVHYSQGGLAESFTVRSSGPDGMLHTDDDVAVARAVVNFKGVGQGLKKNAEEAAAKVAKGAVRGAADEVKEQVKALLRPKPRE